MLKYTGSGLNTLYATVGLITCVLSQFLSIDEQE